MFDKKIIIHVRLTILFLFFISSVITFLLFNDKFQLQWQEPIFQTPTKSMHLSFEEDDKGNNNPQVIPLNVVTKTERISWFQKNIHHFNIFESTNLSLQFHDRVLRFFSHECEVKFFMTWISPASLFESREMLSIESLFKVHPHACLAIISTTLDSKQGNHILKPMVDQGYKIEAMTPNLHFLFQNTPAETWLVDLIQGKKDPGKIPLPQNLSNLIRLVALYKYGGIYLDTDFIMIKSFKGLRNCIGAQSADAVSHHWTRLNNAVLVFDKDHPLLLRFIEEFALNFNGNKWGYNGPYLVSRVVERVKDDGLNFTVLPPKMFYPVDWIKIGGWFQKPKNRDEFRWVTEKLNQLRAHAYGVHLWNKWSGKLEIEQGSIMAKLISQHILS